MEEADTLECIARWQVLAHLGSQQGLDASSAFGPEAEIERLCPRLTSSMAVCCPRKPMGRASRWETRPYSYSPSHFAALKHRHVPRGYSHQLTKPTAQRIRRCDDRPRLYGYALGDFSTLCGQLDHNRALAKGGPRAHVPKLALGQSPLREGGPVLTLDDTPPNAIKYEPAAVGCANCAAHDRTGSKGCTAEPVECFAIAAICFFAGLYVAVQEALELTVTADMVSPDRLAMSYGALGTVNGMAMFVSSSTVGVLWTIASPVFGFALAAVLMVAGTLALARVPRR